MRKQTKLENVKLRHWSMRWIAHDLRKQAEKVTSEDLCQEAGYFEHHKRRMNYLEMRTEDWLIGS